MGRSFAFLVAVLILVVGALGAQADFGPVAPVNVDIYAGFSDSGGGAPFSGLVGSFGSLDVMFATNTGYNWHPFGLGAFGADITGTLFAAADNNYGFSLNSDDGSLLFIDGNLVIDNGGPHAPQIASNSVFLTAGSHAFEVQFFEDFGGPSGVDLYLPSGVRYCGNPQVPEASSMLLAISGLLSVGGGLRLRRK